MKKKKAKYGIDPIVDKRNDIQKSAWESTYSTPIVTDPNAVSDPMMKLDQSQSDRPAPTMLPDQYYTSKTDQYNTGIYDLHPIFQGVNTLALATTGIAQAINEGKNSRAERLKYLQSLQNRFVENNPVLNDQPAYMKDGGGVNPLINSRPTRSDSLAAMNNSSKVLDFYRKAPGYSELQDTYNTHEDVHNGNIMAFENVKRNVANHQPPSTMRNNNFITNDKHFNTNEYYKKLNDFQYLQREQSVAALNLNSVPQFFDKRIAPTAKHMFVNNQLGDVAEIHGYDPLLVKPADMKTKADIDAIHKKYGNVFDKNLPVIKDTKKVSQSKSLPLNSKPPIVVGNKKVDSSIVSNPNDIEYNKMDAFGNPLSLTPQQQKTPYSFTYMNNDMPDQQATQYFDSLDEWKQFIKDNRDVQGSEEGKDYATARGYKKMEKGGQVDNEFDTIPSYLYYIKATQDGNKEAQELAAKHIRDVRGDETSRAMQLIGKNIGTTSIHDMAKRGIDTEKNPQIKHLYSLINENPDLIDKFDYKMPQNKEIAFNIPKMPYGGGPLTSKGAKEILKDGTIRGKKLTEKQKRYFGYIAGGGKPKAKYGIDEREAIDNGEEERVEAEGGEVYTDESGNVMKIPDHYPSHEEGGVPLNNVDRVLEDTSTTRKDITSKALKISPDKFQAMFGFDIKKPVSHSAALEKASEHFNKKSDKVKKGIDKATDILLKNKNDVYANNSLDINLKTVKSIPTENNVFDVLFQHQETVKDMLGVEQDKAKYGKYVPKAAFGIPPPDKTGRWAYDVNNKNGKSKGWNGMKDFSSAQDYATKIGFPGNPNDVVALQRWVMKKYPALVKYFHDPKTGYGMPAAGTPDDGKLGVRWNDIGKIIMDKVPAMPKTDDPNLTPPDAPVAPTTAPEQAPTTPAVTPGLNLKPSGSPSKFNEPLRWYDVAGPLMNLTSSDRIPAQYNPMEFNEVKLKLQNPTPALEAGNRDYNAALNVLPDSGAGMANATNAFSNKYSLDNQILSQYENANAQTKNQETMYNANVRDKQSAADQQSRSVFEQQMLGSKEAQRQQKLRAFDDLFTRVALNRKLNREGNLLMQLAPNFNQQGQYNGNQRYITPTYDASSANGGNGTGITYITDPRTGKQLPVLKENGKLQNKSKILSGLPK